MRLSLKESRMAFLEATNLDRKSGIRGPKTMGDPGFSYFALLARVTCAALLKESRMKSINATGLHRKSGGKPTTAFRSGPYPLVHWGPKPTRTLPGYCASVRNLVVKLTLPPWGARNP